MKKVERQEGLLLEQLKMKKRLSLSEAIDLLKVSESTVRRLFIRLENGGFAIRSYGGIQLVGNHPIMDYSYDQVEGRSVEQKKMIGERAALLPESGDMLYLDSGTTMAHLCAAMAGRIERKELSGVTVFTNSLVNLELLYKYVPVSLIGGEYRASRKDFCGYMAEEAVKNLHFTKCFLGADGYHLHHGFTATDFQTARLNELAIRNTDRRLVLMDSSKFTVTSVVSYSRNQLIHTLITDRLPEEALIRRLSEQGTEILACV